MVPDPPDTLDLSALIGSAPPAKLVVTADFGSGPLDYILVAVEGESPPYYSTNGSLSGTAGSVHCYSSIIGETALIQLYDDFGGAEGNYVVANPTTDFPHLVDWSSHSSEGTATGTPVVRALPNPPASINLASGGATVAASLATALSGANNDLVFTSVPAGRLGNDITVRYVAPGTNNAALAVAVAGRDITVNLATNGSAAVTSTAAQIKTGIEASAAASALVAVANAAGNNGSGVVTALAATALSGGAGGLPLPPETVAI